jgi:hypothetical protein
MSSQAQAQTQTPVAEFRRFSTLRFSFPEETLENVQRMRLIGKDLLVYTEEADLESVRSKFDTLGFRTVERIYKLHVSTPDKTVFESLFGDVVYEDRSNSGRFIATVTVDSEEEYNRFITFDGTDGVRVKSFRARFNVSHDNSSDTREHIEHEQGEWQQQRHHRPRHYTTEVSTEAPFTERAERTERTERVAHHGPHRGGYRGTQHGSTHRDDTQRGDTQRGGSYRGGSQRGGSQRGRTQRGGVQYSSSHH